MAGALDLGRELGPDAVILINLSGRGDKDVETASRWFGLTDPDEVTADNTHNNTETDFGPGTVHAAEDLAGERSREEQV